MTLVSLSDVRVDFGARTLFSGITFTVAARDRWGIVGRNGTGKTTLFRLLTGELEPTAGAIARQPGLRVALLDQHRDFGAADTVWEAAAGELHDLLTLERSLAAQATALAHDASAEALERYGRDLERFEHEGGYTVTSRIDAVLDGLGFDPVKARTTAVSVLSGGERGRLGLARQLSSTADLLLLDEPTNHLDLDTSAWLERYLHDLDRTVMVVSHDRAFLAATVDHVLHFEDDSATAYHGSYQSFVIQRAERRLTQQRAFAQQQSRIAQESDYIARNIAGQNSRQAKGRRKRLERLPRLSPPPSADDTMALRFDAHHRSGDRVVQAADVAVKIADRVLLEHFNGTLLRGDVLGLVGPNGAGKTTLIRALFGERQVAGGDLRLGASIDAGWYRQDMSQVPLGTTIYGAIEELRPTWTRGLIQGHLGRFGFSGDEVQRRVDTLSGGERARVALAMLVLSNANLLVLDEPTNHLDVESIEALEDALDGYTGTVLLVSHDRELLRALTTKVWVLHDQRITEFHGGFAEWEAVSAGRAQAEAARAAEEAARQKARSRKHAANVRDREARTDPRRARRAAEREAADAEADVGRLEAEVTALTSALDDRELYMRADGVAEATRLGAELAASRRALEAAIERWTAATEHAESVAAEAAEAAPEA